MGIKTDLLKKACQAKGLKYVGSRGYDKAPVVVIGEAPGSEEDQAGLPFVGPSGKEQDRMLSEAGFSLSDIRFTNPYKVRPPDNDLTKLAKLGVPLEAYERAFFEELEESSPTIIIPVGATPLSLLCPDCTHVIKKKDGTVDRKVEITKWRGSLLSSPFLNWPHYVIPNLHPAFILRSWNERQCAVLCYAKARRELDYFKSHGALDPLPARTLVTDSPWEDLRRFLLEDCLGANRPLSVDIEMIHRKMPYVLGIATSPSYAISFCIWDYEKNAEELFCHIANVLTQKRVIGQNFLSFDAPWLETIAIPINVANVSDTLVRSHVLWPELEKKLQWLTVQYTRQPYYKDEGKNINIKTPADRLRLMHYNALDCAVTYEVWLAQEEELNEAM